MLRAALLYAAFVVYGSLVPLVWRYRPLDHAWAAFLETPYLQLGMGSRADWIANILLYIPLGFLASGWLAARLRAVPASVAVFLLCALLALGVEFAQLFFPPRTVSLNDLLAELIGTCAGIALWHAAGDRLLRGWREILDGGPQVGRALIALYAAAYLVFALFPYDFLVSAAELARKLASPGGSAWLVVRSCGGTLGCGAKLAAEIVTVAPLGIFFGMVASSRNSQPGLLRAFALGLALGAVIEGLQTFLASGVSQGASVLTRGLGMALGLAAYRHLRADWLLEHRSQLRIATLLALPVYLALLLALAGGFTSSLDTRWEALAKLDAVRFLPFYYHYFTSETQAMRSLLIHAGAYAPVGVVVWVLGSGRGGRGALWLSAAAALLLAAAMETLKLFLEGRRPDPTDALIAAAAAALACFAMTRIAHWGSRPVPQAAAAKQSRPARVSRSHPRLRGAALAGGLLASGAALAGWLIAMQPREHYVDESKLAQLPAPEALPPVRLPGFKSAHPRLPSPAPGELALLAKYNPGFLSRVEARAQGGQGDLESAALQELIAPGSVDLELLHRRLMALEFNWRGHSQVKPLAVAYDWLHQRWSEPQRALLRGKLAEGCQYLIDYIRQERLSPYNVILYNSPLQALMACSLALYGDDPRGEPVMRFTHDLWKHRVLPAWRQVMGENGGWHEGGEYVGIGIGQAIYQLPAMWRSATGEDLVAAEPGIRGFLDFLVYRTRPDGMHFRWGDAGWLDRRVPDAIPLALELRHAAAYSLYRPERNPEPSSWPWGPLTDATLFDAGAAARLPLARHLDGIGMIVARSDWSPDATYVTFKAGDNYWSHSHLDQGAFTIYKGGPLAIDSGLYGPKYGSDHHMNYTYQTIAHNTITVTDPADTVPAPGKERLRPIANDGGQRRVGSGWGVEAAPLDRDEWEAKRDIYHTGTLEHLLDAGGLVVAVADLTPAYTNQRSGQGTFSHRTRRVERFWRVFGYDRVDDVVVVFDQVVATRAALRKRWLLHTIEAPRMAPDGFSVSVAPRDQPGRAGGRLEAKVLLPRQAVIHAIGGEGFEFFVDDRNYDEDGKLAELLAKLELDNGEPGAWRIEVSPPQDNVEDAFLVVLLPSTLGAKPAHRVRLLEAGGRTGCEISGPTRTTRWWFEPGKNGAEIEVVSGGDDRRYRLDGASAPPPPGATWLSRFLEAR